MGGRVRDAVLSIGGSVELGAQWGDANGSPRCHRDFGPTRRDRPRGPRGPCGIGLADSAIVAAAHVEDGVARALGYVVRTELCAEPSQVSATVLLELYSDLASDTLLQDSESDRAVDVPERIAHALAGALAEPVRLEQSVVRIENQPDDTSRHDAVRVHVTGVIRSQVDDGCSDFYIDAAAAVLAVPSVAIPRIRWVPALPGWLDQGLQRRPMGAVIKAATEYPEPFWRRDGRSGSAILVGHEVASIVDSTPDGRQGGVLNAFIVGDAVHRVSRLPASERHRIFVAAAVSALGDEAAAPLAIHEAIWADEPNVRGGYGPYSPPGLGEAEIPPIGSGTPGFPRRLGCRDCQRRVYGRRHPQRSRRRQAGRGPIRVLTKTWLAHGRPRSSQPAHPPTPPWILTKQRIVATSEHQEHRRAWLKRPTIHIHANLSRRLTGRALGRCAASTRENSTRTPRSARTQLMRTHSSRAGSESSAPPQRLRDETPTSRRLRQSR